MARGLRAPWPSSLYVLLALNPAPVLSKTVQPPYDPNNVFAKILRGEKVVPFKRKVSKTVIL